MIDRDNPDSSPTGQRGEWNNNQVITERSADRLEKSHFSGLKSVRRGRAPIPKGLIRIGLAGFRDGGQRWRARGREHNPAFDMGYSG